MFPPYAGDEHFGENETIFSTNPKSFSWANHRARFHKALEVNSRAWTRVSPSKHLILSLPHCDDVTSMSSRRRVMQMLEPSVSEETWIWSSAVQTPRRRLLERFSRYWRGYYALPCNRAEVRLTPTQLSGPKDHNIQLNTPNSSLYYRLLHPSLVLRSVWATGDCWVSTLAQVISARPLEDSNR